MQQRFGVAMLHVTNGQGLGAIVNILKFWKILELFFTRGGQKGGGGGGWVHFGGGCGATLLWEWDHTPQEKVVELGMDENKKVNKAKLSTCFQPRVVLFFVLHAPAAA